MFWTYTCPVCGLVVRTDHQTVQIIEIKVCQCDGTPVEAQEASE